MGPYTQDFTGSDGEYDGPASIRTRPPAYGSPDLSTPDPRKGDIEDKPSFDPNTLTPTFGWREVDGKILVTDSRGKTIGELEDDFGKAFGLKTRAAAQGYRRRPGSEFEAALLLDRLNGRAVAETPGDIARQKLQSKSPRTTKTHSEWLQAEANRIAEAQVWATLELARVQERKP